MLLLYVRLLWRWGLRRWHAAGLSAAATLPNGEPIDGADPWRGIIARF